MANPFTTEFNRLVFQSFAFMEAVFEQMEDAADEEEDNLDEFWGVESEEEGGPAAYVTIEARRHGKKEPFLEVTRWFPQPGCDETLPLYVNVLRDDEEELWDDLVEEFPEATVFEDDTSLGFEWALPAEAPIEQVRAAGKKLGARLTRAIWGE